MYEITVRSKFSAAHQIRGYGGKCEELHGHNWAVEATGQSPDINETGMVMDFAELKKALGKLLALFDHKFINDLPQFKEINPTSENIARLIYKSLEKSVTAQNIDLSSVTVWESDTSWATYSEQ